MAKSFDADVIIAGAGMAGATLGLALSQGGLKVILVDPAPFETQLAPSFDGRASAIAYANFRAFRTLGLAPSLEPHAQRIEQILVTEGDRPGAASRGTSPFALRFSADEIEGRGEGEPLGYMIENRHIRAAQSQALESAGIEVRAPAKVAGVEFTPGAAEVKLESGQILSAPLVVGADGRGSRVRTAAGIGDSGWSYGQSGVVATVELERPHGGIAYEYYLPTGPFAILPLPGQRASLVWTEKTARAQAVGKASDEVFHAYLHRRFGEFMGAARRTGPTFVYPLSLSLADRMVAPRAALLGDAAHIIHPLAGQGLNLGLKGAAALAEVVIEASRIGEDIGSEAVLERYASWRRLDTAAMAAATDGFNRLFLLDHPLLRLGRGLGMAAVGAAGPLRRGFMREAGGALGDLPRLLRGQPI